MQNKVQGVSYKCDQFSTHGGPPKYIYNKYLKKTLKIPLKIECHFATSAHAERYVARLVRGWNPFEWVPLSSG